MALPLSRQTLDAWNIGDRAGFWVKLSSMLFCWRLPGSRLSDDSCSSKTFRWFMTRPRLFSPKHSLRHFQEQSPMYVGLWSSWFCPDSVCVFVFSTQRVKVNTATEALLVKIWKRLNRAASCETASWPSFIAMKQRRVCKPICVVNTSCQALGSNSLYIQTTG